MSHSGRSSTVEPQHASALIYNDEAGQYLLPLRDDGPHIWEPGTRSCIGGGREPEDGSLEDTVRRELREETGIQFTNLQHIAMCKRLTRTEHRCPSPSTQENGTATPAASP